MTSLRPDHVLLTLLSGESRCTSWVLRWGVAAPALTIGARADWEVRAPGVDGVHVRLSFDGCRLRAAAVSARGASLQNRALGVDLRDVPFPFELVFGRARLAGHVVGSKARSVTACAERAAMRAPLAGPTLGEIDPMETGYLDLASLTQAALMARPILAVGAPAPEASAPSLPPASTPARPRAARVRSHDTLCDGGALRDYARRLSRASLAGREVLPSPSPAEERATKLGRCATRRARRTEHTETPEPLGSAPGALLARWKRTRERLLGLPRPRQWAASPVAAALLLAGWSLLAMPGRAANPGAPTQPPAPLASDARAAPLEPSAAPATASKAPLPQASTSLRAPLELTEPSPVTSSARELSSSLALDAFRAAHAGDTARAVALYQRLAHERSEPVYRHAARAVADNRVATP